MKVIIAAGGTGGHIFPGIAIAREILRRDGTAKVVFVGTQYGLETKLVPQAGFELMTVSAGALNNVPWSKRVASLGKMMLGFFSGFKLLRKMSPDLVIGVGGYASGIVVLEAALKGIPTMVVEPNALPGLTNRILGRFVKAAAITFQESARFFPGKAVLTGTPVRAEFEAVPARQRESVQRLLIFGGSQGARAINHAMVEALPRLVPFRDQLAITHQTGTADLETVRQGYQEAGFEADIRPFIDDMAGCFARADLLICRAGAATAAEIAAAGKAAIFIPFPLAADDHQRKNAEAFVRAGAGVLIVQADLTGKRLADEIWAILNQPDHITTMEQASRRLSHSNAVGRVVDLAIRVAQRASFSELVVEAN